MQEDWKTLPLYRAAMKYSVTPRTIQRWRKLGHMPTRQRRSDEMKTFVVENAIKHGVAFTSKKVGVSRDTIYKWMKEKKRKG
jgi:predicted site-specific integrase-resolvase